MGELAIALDIGGTKSAAALVGPSGTVTRLATAPTPGLHGPTAILDTAASLLRPLVAAAAADGDQVVGLGVGSAGVVDATAGVIVSATQVLRDWAGTPLRSELARRSDVPFVRVDNDVHTHALGELVHGSASGRSSLFFVAVGTGIGASVVVEHQVLHGHHHVAGHFGHLPSPAASGLPCVCGGFGHLEAVAAGPAMVAAYNACAGADLVSLTEVTRLAADGDHRAAHALESGAQALGSAVGGVANLLDPEVVVVGGGVVGAGRSWWEAMERSVRAELLPPLRDLPVVPSTLGPRAALLGAAELVWRELR